MSWADIYNQYVKSYEGMNEFYNDYINKMKKLNELFELNQQWLESVWGPFLAKVQVQEKEKIKTTTEETKE
jgi:hypothetical protein